MTPTSPDALFRIASALGLSADAGGAPDLEAVLDAVADLRRRRDAPEPFVSEETIRTDLETIGVPGVTLAGRRSTREMVLDLMRAGRALSEKYERAANDERDIRVVLQEAGIAALRDGRDVSTPSMVRDLARCLHVAEAEREATLRDVREALGLREGLSPEEAAGAMRELAREASTFRAIRAHAAALQSVYAVLAIYEVGLSPTRPTDRR